MRKRHFVTAEDCNLRLLSVRWSAGQKGLICHVQLMDHNMSDSQSDFLSIGLWQKEQVLDNMLLLPKYKETNGLDDCFRIKEECPAQ